jgi:pyridoxal phosphate enzyme (YggS family)
MLSLTERLELVSGQVADAARSAGRDPAEVTTIVVTKFHPASVVRELHALGVRDFGENRHQEAQAKAAEAAGLDGVRWHFIGQLQSNKAKAVREYASAVHSVDRGSLVNALGEGDPLDVFVQVDLSGEPGRGGVHPAELDGLVETVLAAPDLRLRGLMTVAPLGTEPRRAFADLRELSERIRSAAPHARDLSMGMSGDFREAIQEGATHLRIGTAITGNRPTPR